MNAEWWARHDIARRRMRRAAFTATVFALIVAARAFVKSNPYAGVLTYPVYLVHGQFGFFLIDTLHDRLPRYAVLLLTTAIVMIMAYVIHRLVEKPLARPLRRAIERALSDRSPTSSS